MKERNKGHPVIALGNVLSRVGRYRFGLSESWNWIAGRRVGKVGIWGTGKRIVGL